MKNAVRITLASIVLSPFLSGCGNPNLKGTYVFQDDPRNGLTLTENGHWTDTYGDAGEYALDGQTLVFTGPLGIRFPGKVEGDQIVVKWVSDGPNLVDRTLIRNNSTFGRALQISAEAEKFWDRKDYSRATPLLQEAAELGHTPAQRLLGCAYALGKGVSQDHTKAVEWWQKAVAQGDSKACYFLAGAYWEGVVVSQDRTKAIKLCQEAADGGFAMAQNNLAWFYAASTDSKYQSGDMALQYALKAIAQEPENWYVVGTLAAAYARSGNFHQAISKQEQTIQLMRNATGFASTEAKQDQLRKARVSLELFRRREAYSEDVPPVFLLRSTNSTD